MNKYVYTKTILTPPLFIEVIVPRQKSERSCTDVRGIDFASIFYGFSIISWNCSESVVFYIFHLFIIYIRSVSSEFCFYLKGCCTVQSI